MAGIFHGGILATIAFAQNGLTKRYILYPVVWRHAPFVHLHSANRFPKAVFGRGKLTVTTGIVLFPAATLAFALLSSGRCRCVAFGNPEIDPEATVETAIIQ
ncbi:hypothetical protein [Cupriavidus pauculus]|uniref:hypothetical protein n=1 Tax=Cupriavidus pauculus TaxID=82633 RepID=UPI0011AEFAB0|nr:hypothetical protein [Cupriavidus pauculus]